MKVSIIIPVYNSEKYIGNCIECIKNQTYDNWEIIIVDDQSKDKSYEICKDYAESDTRISLVRQINSGSGVARNKGIEMATGEYIMFCDADDFLLPDSLKMLIEEKNRTGADLIIGGYKEYKERNGKILFCGQNKPETEYIKGIQNVRDRYIGLFEDALIQAPWAKLYSTDIIKKNNVIFADYRRCQDTVFNISYYDYISSIAIISEPVYAYQTPEGDIYIRKFPVDMIDIRLNIDNVITKKLIDWKCFDNKSKEILNRVLMIDILVCCRLNFMNNWSNEEECHKIYINELLSKLRVQEVLKGDYGFIRNILCMILRTKNYILIKYVNKLLLFCLRYK